MSTPYDHYFWQLRELQRILEQMAPEVPALQSLPTTIQEQLNQFQFLEEQFTLPREYLDIVRQVEQGLQLKSSLDQFSLLADRHSENLRQLQDHYRQFAQLPERLSQLFDQIADPTERLIESLVPIEALLRSVEMSETVLEAALLPQLAYEDFVSVQLDLAAAAATTLAAANRMRFVYESGELLDRMAKSIEFAILMSKDIVTGQLELDWDVNLYASLSRRAEGVDFEAEEFEAEGFVASTCEARIVDLGQRLIRRVYDLNLESRREGKPNIFEPTNKLLYACSLIPTNIATSDSSFSRIVDQLYFLLYEGSGDGKRLVQLRSADRLQALWHIKHLRRSARHDIDHGDKAEILRKRKETGQAFRDLIGEVVPKADIEWCRAQQVLYSRVVEMLDELWFGAE